MNTISFVAIGTIHTPHKTLSDMPIQPNGAKGISGFIELQEELIEGLSDLDGFSHLTLLYHLHKVEKCELKVTPFMDSVPRGIFATRSPIRPNPIGLSTVKLKNIEGNRIHIEDVDMLDGSPLIDIKPFFGEMDNRYNVSLGWLDKSKGSCCETVRSDERFV